MFALIVISIAGLTLGLVLGTLSEFEEVEADCHANISELRWQ